VTVSDSAWLQNRNGRSRDGLFVIVKTWVFAALKKHYTNWTTSPTDVNHWIM